MILGIKNPSFLFSNYVSVYLFICFFDICIDSKNQIRIRTLLFNKKKLILD